MSGRDAHAFLQGQINNLKKATCNALFYFTHCFAVYFYKSDQIQCFKMVEVVNSCICLQMFLEQTKITACHYDIIVWALDPPPYRKTELPKRISMQRCAVVKICQVSSAFPFYLVQAECLSCVLNSCTQMSHFFCISKSILILLLCKTLFKQSIEIVSCLANLTMGSYGLIY